MRRYGNGWRRIRRDRSQAGRCVAHGISLGATMQLRKALNHMEVVVSHDAAETAGSKVTGRCATPAALHRLTSTVVAGASGNRWP